MLMTAHDEMWSQPCVLFSELTVEHHKETQQFTFK